MYENFKRYNHGHQNTLVYFIQACSFLAQRITVFWGVSGLVSGKERLKEPVVLCSRCWVFHTAWGAGDWKLKRVMIIRCWINFTSFISGCFIGMLLLVSLGWSWSCHFCFMSMDVATHFQLTKVLLLHLSLVSWTEWNLLALGSWPLFRFCTTPLWEWQMAEQDGDKGHPWFIISY